MENITDLVRPITRETPSRPLSRKGRPAFAIRDIYVEFQIRRVTDRLIKVDASRTGGRNSLTYEWSWGNEEPKSYGETASHVYNEGGNFVIELRVSDPFGNQALASQSITINEYISLITDYSGTDTALFKTTLG